MECNSITYMNLNEKDSYPYKVNNFNWDKKTQETIVEVTISGNYIKSNEDITVELKVGKFNKNPNHNYYIPPNCFCVNKYGNIIVDYEKYQRKNMSRRDPYQWEFDRQAYKECIGETNQSINATVWYNVDNFIIMN